MQPCESLVTLQRRLPVALQDLATLAFNYWWTWSGEQLRLFSTIDHRLWEECHHNPVLFLRRVSQERLDEVATDPDYVQMLQALMVRFRQYMQAPLREGLPGITPNHPVAYFCAEFGLHQYFPRSFYSSIL